MKSLAEITVAECRNIIEQCMEKQRKAAQYIERFQVLFQQEPVAWYAEEIIRGMNRQGQASYEIYFWQCEVASKIRNAPWVVETAEYQGDGYWADLSPLEFPTEQEARDFEEGMGGPVYNVCRDCVNKENDRINEELEYQDEHYGPLDDDFDDDFDDDDFDDEPLEDWKVIDTTQIDDGGCCKVVAICWSEAEASIAIKNLGKESRENYVKMMDGLYHIDPPYAE